jgi:phage I-like protein
MDGIIETVSREIEGVPPEIQVIPYGEHHTDKGTFVLDDEAAAAVMREAGGVTNDMVIDYEHQTLKDVEAPAAGWIKQLVNKGKDGIWAVVEWTPRAVEYLKNKEYRYLSPVFLRRLSDSRVVRFLHASLTNAPAIDGMVPLVNRKGDFIPPAYPPYVKDVETKQKEVHIMKRLMAALGLTETATEDDAIAAVAALKADAEAIVANKAVFEALELDPSAPESEVTGLITALKASNARVDEATRRAEDLTEQLKQRDAEEAVAFAMNAGKITPAERQWAGEYALRDLEGFKTYVNKTPVKIHRGEAARDTVFSRSLAHDEAQLTVNKMLGVTDELHRKHHGVGK